MFNFPVLIRLWVCLGYSSSEVYPHFFRSISVVASLFCALESENRCLVPLKWQSHTIWKSK